MKPTTEGAQLAIEVADRLCARPSPDSVARVDEILVGWSHLSVGRSAISRALAQGSGVWDATRDQVTRSLEPGGENLRPSMRSGIWAGGLIERAEAASGTSTKVREQDIVAGLIAYAPNAMRMSGVDEERFLALVRESEGEMSEAAVPAPISAQDRRLDEIDALATALIERLERGELLSAVLPVARRLAERANRPMETAWLHLEAVGLAGDARSGQRTRDELAGAGLFQRLHATIDARRLDVNDIRGSLDVGPLDRPMVAPQSIAALETVEGTPVEGPIYDTEVANMTLHSQVFAKEARHIVNVVRQEVHRFVSRLQASTRRDRAALELFGPDAIVVLDARSDLLEQLRLGVEALERPAGKAAAAQAARVVVMALGRELYHGPKDEHISPRTQQTFRITSEMHMLFALLDDLWMRMPERRPQLETAYAAADEAYSIGSRKDPQTITDDLARRALQSAYRVAHTLLVCGALLQTAYA